MHIPGIIHRSAVDDLDLEPGQFATWLRQGSVRSVQPWYVTAAAPPDLVAILQQGVRPTCLDAAALHGLWVPPRPEAVHVFRPRRARGHRRASGTGAAGDSLATARPIRRRGGKELGAPQAPVPLLHHGPALRSWPDTAPVPQLSLVLEHAARCLTAVDAATLFESALEQGRVTDHQAEQIVASLPHRQRRDLGRIRRGAGSGTETTVRWWLESLGVPVRVQVHIGTVGRVDILAGRRWIIECDSREFHDDEQQYARDRARDLELQFLGFRVTRLTWEQVFVSWRTTRPMLLAILRRGDHLRPPAPSLIRAV